MRIFGVATAIFAVVVVVFALMANMSSSVAVAQGTPGQGDHTFRVTHIKFDHVGADRNPTDGLNIRRDRANDLQHRGNGRGEGEWIRGGVRNEEALYIAGKNVTIKVRIECDNYVKSARFWAVEALPQPPLPPQAPAWLNVSETVVNFVEVKPGTLWRSNPEYVEFSLGGATKDHVDESVCTWQWHVKDIDSSAPSDPPDPNPNQFEVENSGPHTFYTVLEVPFEPWYTGSERTHPWVTALAFGINYLGVRGYSATTAVLQHVTYTIWDRGLPAYDHDQGPPLNLHSRYVPDTYPRPLPNPRSVVTGEADSQWELAFNLTDYINVAYTEGDCLDLAAGVQTCANLFGARGRFYSYAALGYILPQEFASIAPPGANVVNNPFYLRNQDPTDPSKVYGMALVVPDHLYEDANPVDGFYDRSFFAKHTYVLLGGTGGVVFDSTMGPYDGNLSHAAYIAAIVDTSTPAEAAATSGLDQYYCSILTLN